MDFKILKNNRDLVYTSLLSFYITHSPFYSGEAWRCYFCKSDVSWDHCVENRRVDICKSPLNRCTKFFWEYEHENGTVVQLYEKGCGYHFECDSCSRHECALEKSRKCEVNCCLADLCNNGPTSRINTPLLWVTVLATVTRIVFKSNG